MLELDLKAVTSKILVPRRRQIARKATLTNQAPPANRTDTIFFACLLSRGIDAEEVSILVEKTLLKK